MLRKHSNFEKENNQKSHEKSKIIITVTPTTCTLSQCLPQNETASRSPTPPTIKTSGLVLALPLISHVPCFSLSPMSLAPPSVCLPRRPQVVPTTATRPVPRCRLGVVTLFITTTDAGLGLRLRRGHSPFPRLSLWLPARRVDFGCGCCRCCSRCCLIGDGGGCRGGSMASSRGPAKFVLVGDAQTSFASLGSFGDGGRGSVGLDAGCAGGRFCFVAHRSSGGGSGVVEVTPPAAAAAAFCFQDSSSSAYLPMASRGRPGSSMDEAGRLQSMKGRPAASRLATPNRAGRCSGRSGQSMCSGASV